MDEMDSDEEINLPVKKLFGGTVLTIIILVLLSMSVVIVPAGHKAVGVDGVGGIGSQYDRGFNLKHPFLKTEKVRWNTQYLKIDTQVITDDGYNVPVIYEIQYNLDEEEVGEIRVNNPQYKEKIKMELEAQITLVANEMNLTGLQLNRERAKFNTRVEAAVKDALGMEYLHVQSVRIRNVDMPKKILQAAEQRESARIDVETAAFELNATKRRSLKKEVKAAAEANATVQLAEGQAESIEILSGQAENMTTEMMNYIIRQKYINALRDPETNVKWILTDGNNGLILNLDQNETLPDGTTNTTEPLTN